MKIAIFVGLVIATGMECKAQPITAGIVAAGYAAPTPIKVAPGQLITVFVHGLGSNLTKAVRATTRPLPSSLAGISAKFIQYNPEQIIPILAVEPIATCTDRALTGCSSYVAITVQIPFEIQADDPTSPRGGPVGGALLLFFENGVPAAGVDLTPVVDQVHLLHSCDLVLLNRDSACRPIVVHANGKLVTSSDPADAGEQIVIYGVGLGWPSTPIPTGDTVTALSPTSIQFRIGFDARPNALASRPPLITEASGNLAMPPAFSGLTAGFVGLYQVNVVVPSLPKGATACSAGPVGRVESNMTINVAGPASFAGVGICVRTEP